MGKETSFLSTPPESRQTIPDFWLSHLSEFVASQMGLHFPKERWYNLERGICSAIHEFGFKDAESCIQWLLSARLTKNQIEILASHLTVGETYFFREKKSFDILEEHILPELIRSRQDMERRLRIWSAGSSTGEEPYSIAILLNKMLLNLKDWNITIRATDINPRFLQKASEGVYNKWSFRDTLPWIKERYFKKTKEDRFEILPYIKKLVSFSYLNLAEDSYPSLLNNTNAMDIIFCRNVLMYFDQERQRKVIQNLYRCLIEGGWLIVSPSETSHVLFSQFMAVNFSGATFYKKDSKKSQTVEDFVLKEIPSCLVSDVMAPFQKPPFEYVGEPESKVTFPEPLPLEAEEQKIAEPKRTLYEEALALYEQCRYEEAVDKILFLLSHNKIDSKAFTLLARAYANQGKLSEALEWCEKAIVADKLNPGCHYLLATILQERGRVEEAVVSLKRALYFDQNFVLAHFALGNLNQQQGKFKEAKKHFKNALSLLNAYPHEDILPESEGITAGRLMEIIRLTIED